MDCKIVSNWNDNEQEFHGDCRNTSHAQRLEWHTDCFYFAFARHRYCIVGESRQEHGGKEHTLHVHEEDCHRDEVSIREWVVFAHNSQLCLSQHNQQIGRYKTQKHLHKFYGHRNSPDLLFEGVVIDRRRLILVVFVLKKRICKGDSNEDHKENGYHKFCPSVES